jgi:hypothetical protein
MRLVCELHEQPGHQDLRTLWKQEASKFVPKLRARIRGQSSNGQYLSLRFGEYYWNRIDNRPQQKFSIEKRVVAVRMPACPY